MQRAHTRSVMRSRWAAIGAAVAVTFGASVSAISGWSGSGIPGHLIPLEFIPDATGATYFWLSWAYTTPAI